MSQSNQTKWILKSDQASNPQVNDSEDLPRILSVLLNQRGILKSDREVFLHPKLRDLQDPFLLPEMDLAVARILQAVDNGESVCIYGDYDVDGVTSVALMYKTLVGYGIEPNYFIPSRSGEGYGVSEMGMKRLLKEVPKLDLLITVDCGTGSNAEIDTLVEMGIDVIIVDHHEMSPAGRPNCVALVNPKYQECNFEYLCAAGVVFKLAHALLKTRKVDTFDLKNFIELVAVATISDIVPLIDENRLLVRHGLERLPCSINEGLRALQEIADVKAKVTSLDVGFRIGPRINAAGRMDEPEDALDILLTEDKSEAVKIATKLNHHNLNRQALERKIREEALQMLNDKFDAEKDPVIVLGSRNWHPGVVGIVASRLMRQFYKPTFIIAIDEHGNGKGSGRSIEGVSLVSAIHSSSDHLESGGGHDMAAGISIKEEKLDHFRKAFGEHVEKQASSDVLAPRIYIDAEVEFSELDLAFLDSYELLQPFGSKNPQPTFMSKNVWLTEPPKELKNKHIKLFLKQNYDERDAIFFSGGERDLPELPWDIAFTIDRNTFRGRTSLHIVIQDVRAAVTTF